MNFQLLDSPLKIQPYHRLSEEIFEKNLKIKCIRPENYQRENLTFVGLFEETLIGGAYLLNHGNQNAQIHQLVIDMPYQRQGYGKKLLQKVEMMAAENNIRHLYAHTYFEVKGFYEKCGYRAMREAGIPTDVLQQKKPASHAFMYKLVDSTFS